MFVAHVEEFSVYGTVGGVGEGFYGPAAVLVSAVDVAARDGDYVVASFHGLYDRIGEKFPFIFVCFSRVHGTVGGNEEEVGV